uniref:Per os infectivity factor 8 n=1 Tax=Nesodiprion zhejiangensis nucleopolyhedrovirus TaxID=3135970 RepID=A0AAN0N862_9BACU
MYLILLGLFILISTILCFYFSANGVIASQNNFDYIYYNLNFIPADLIKFINNEYLFTPGSSDY